MPFVALNCRFLNQLLTHQKHLYILNNLTQKSGCKTFILHASIQPTFLFMLSNEEHYVSQAYRIVYVQINFLLTLRIHRIDDVNFLVH